MLRTSKQRLKKTRSDSMGCQGWQSLILNALVDFECPRLLADFDNLLNGCHPSLVAQSIKNLPAMQETTCNEGGVDLIPGSGRSPGRGTGSPLQYSCLGNPMDRGARGLQPMGLQRVRYCLATKPLNPSHSLSLILYILIYMQWF